MRVRALGVVAMVGTAKTGNTFDFAQLKVIMPLEVVASAKMKKHGFGFECVDVDVSPGLVPKFASVTSWPAELELITEERLSRHGIENVVVDFKIPVAVAPARPIGQAAA